MSVGASQFLGIWLALLTAIGCVAYEKLVMRHSYGVIIFLATLFYIPSIICLMISSRGALITEVRQTITAPDTKWWALIYFLTWATTPIWFQITKKQGVLAGSIYEVKYIVILALFYAALGDRPITPNLTIGALLALGSIFFISRS